MLKTLLYFFLLINYTLLRPQTVEEGGGGQGHSLKPSICFYKAPLKSKINHKKIIPRSFALNKKLKDLLKFSWILKFGHCDPCLFKFQCFVLYSCSPNLGIKFIKNQIHMQSRG